MEYSAVQRTEEIEVLGGKDTQHMRAVGARAMDGGGERAIPDEPRFALNARGQAFVADTLGIVCDSPLTNAEISMIAEKIEQNLSDTVPQASLLIQLAVVGQTPAQISRLIGMSPVTAGRYLGAIRRASNIPSVVYEQEPANETLPFAPLEQSPEIIIETLELRPEVVEPFDVPVKQTDETLPPEEIRTQQFHTVTAGILRGGIYRALKGHGVKGYGVIEMAQLSELVDVALGRAAIADADQRAYRGYLETNKPLFVDNPARSLVTEMPILIAEIIVQEMSASSAITEPVPTPSVMVEQLPVRATRRRRVGRTAVARTPLRSTPTVQTEGVLQSPRAEQLPLDVPTMNRLRGGVFRALHKFGVALPPSLEFDVLLDYTRQAMSDQMLTPEVQAAYDTYLRSYTYARSDSELNQAIVAMPEWIAQQIMTEHGVVPGEPVQPEVLAGHKELHMAERQRLAAIAAAELEAARVYLSGTDWERRQALASVGGDSHWLSLFDAWCGGAEPEAIAADSRHDVGMVRRQLLHMAKAAHREKPDVVEAAPSRDWVVDALCSQTDPEIFFPEKGGSTRDAKKVCKECTVRSECHASAEYRKEGYGVWGELSKVARKRQLPVSAR